MNYTCSRFVVIITLFISLTGCFDIPDEARLNTSWETAEAQDLADEPNWFVTDAAATCPLFSSNTSTDSQPGQLPAEFNVADWNIYKQDGDNWQVELAKLAASNDLLILQEAKLSFLPLQLFQQHALSWTQVEAFSIYKQPIGVLTVSNVAPLKACKQTVTEPWLRFPKSSLITYFSWAGSDQPLLVANMHLINFTLGIDEFNQQLAGVMAVISQHTGPVLMAGDFNTWTNKRINRLLEVTAMANLKKITYQQDARITSFGHPLDDMFFSGMRQLSASSYTTEASDHNPIIARFGPLR